MLLASFSSIWIVVCVLKSEPGERKSPLVIAAKNFATGCVFEMTVPGLLGIRHPPYETGPRALVVTIDATAVVAGHLILAWDVPRRIVDLMVEHRNNVNGNRDLIGGFSGALLQNGLCARAGLITGTSPEQIRQRLSATADLFSRMTPLIDLGRALLRGRYLTAVAKIEASGIPVDHGLVCQLAERWSTTKRKLIEIVDQGYGVYHDGRLDETALREWLDRRGIAWPMLPSGRLDLADHTFRDMARAYPVVRNLKEMRGTILDFAPASLTIGRDGRNRTPLRPFASRTGRNQPSAKASVLSTAAWVRQLIKPKPGTGLALIDWSQQEFGIAGALSGDTAMQQAYRSGDPYLALAVIAGAAPLSATSISHPDVRTQYKTCALGIQYGMGAATLAGLIGSSEAAARDLQRRHRAAFPSFWRWSDGVEAQANLTGHLTTVFGWRLAFGADANPRALRNFPLQANGAEMLRLACCLTTEAGIQVCMPSHDALLIEAPLTEIDDTIALIQRLMAEASAIVLDGFDLRTTVRSVRAPDSWSEPKGAAIWSAVMGALDDLEPARERHATCSSQHTRPIFYYNDREDETDAAY